MLRDAADGEWCLKPGRLLNPFCWDKTKLATAACFKDYVSKESGFVRILCVKRAGGRYSDLRSGLLCALSSFILELHAQCVTEVRCRQPFVSTVCTHIWTQTVVCIGFREHPWSVAGGLSGTFFFGCRICKCSQSSMIVSSIVHPDSFRPITLYLVCSINTSTRFVFGSVSTATEIRVWPKRDAAGWWAALCVGRCFYRIALHVVILF